MFIVYGATGFIGRSVQATLTARRTSYVGFGRRACIINKAGTSPEVTDAISTADRASIVEMLPVPKAVIFVAGAAVATADPVTLRASHLNALRDGFASLPQKWLNGLPFVYASSGLVYGRRVSPQPIKETDLAAPNLAYGKIKLECEKLLIQLAVRTGAQAVAARLFNVTGPGHASGIVVDVARQAADICSGMRTGFRLRSNTPILDLIDVQEAAEGLVGLAGTSALPLAVNVCSGRPLTTDDLIDAARRVIGRDSPVAYDDDRGPCEALIGCPDLMAATTGWHAQKPLDQIVKSVILSLPEERNPNA